MSLLNKLAAPIAGLTLMLITAVPVAAVTPPEITRISDQNFTTSTHFDDSPCGPAGTDIATGSFHLVVIDAGDAVHVNYTESVRFISVADDPALPTGTHQATDTFSFNLTKNGTMVVKEIVHDTGFDLWPGNDQHHNLHARTTFVYANGEVVVDQQIVRDPPPDGC